jgi:hypothetical protein
MVEKATAGRAEKSSLKFMSDLQAGLPDFSWYSLPTQKKTNDQNIYQMAVNIPSGRKIYQVAVKYTKNAIKYTKNAIKYTKNAIKYTKNAIKYTKRSYNIRTKWP